MRKSLLPLVLVAVPSFGGCTVDVLDPTEDDVVIEESEEALTTALPKPVPQGASWLTSVNYYRAMAGLGPVTENVIWSKGAYLHSCWMLRNGIGHDELPGTPGYTLEGDAAGNAGNVAVSSSTASTPRSQVDLWMSGPFHAIGILRHNLRTAGYGRCISETGPVWRSGGTLDVIRGLVTAPRPTTPILWPGNGMTTNLDRFIAESPNPVTLCGWTGAAGLPVMAMMPESVSSASATMTGPSGPLTVCTLSGANTTGTAKALLGGDNAVSVLPREPLVPGTYTVTVKTQARTVRWSFTVDPSASTSVGPLPVAKRPPELAAPSGYVPLANPVRIADSRIPKGMARLTGNVAQTLLAGGVSGIPADAVAIAANLTVVNTAANGWLAATNCGVTGAVSNVNFLAGQVVANSAVVPLNPAGQLCLTSNTATDVVVDVVGVYTATGALGFTPSNPIRVATNLAVAAGATVPLVVTGGGRAPTGAPVVAASLNSSSTARGFLRVWPCDQPSPGSSNANYVLGETRTNLAVSRVAANGTLCIYSSSAATVTVDLTGWYAPISGEPGTYSGNTPFRLIDTRTTSWPEANLYNGGRPLAPGTTYRVNIGGARGLPTSAAANLNVTVVGSDKAGGLSLWNCAGAAPPPISLAYGVSSARSTAVHAGLSPEGQLCVRPTSNVHVILDIFGQWR